MSFDSAARDFLRDHGAESVEHPGGTRYAHLCRVEQRLAVLGAGRDLRLCRTSTIAQPNSRSHGPGIASGAMMSRKSARAATAAMIRRTVRVLPGIVAPARRGGGVSAVGPLVAWVVAVGRVVAANPSGGYPLTFGTTDLPHTRQQRRLGAAYTPLGVIT
ncbi:MAG TPA: hypothetical protein VF755_09365 [Catenuloplanes sp.]|jgi:hypothetical protein